MAVTMPGRAAFTRRALLKTVATSAAVTAVGGIARPSLSWAPDRPQITHGVQSGDVSAHAGVVWSRADRPSRMLVEVATTDSFRDIKNAVFVDALPQSDFTAKALIEELPPDQDIFYRISFQDLSSAVFGEPQIGRFRTPPSDRRSVSFLWSGDTMGQGWGIDRSRGGMRTYAAMRRNRPDFFIHCGDNIYADCPIQAEQKLPDGGVWRSVVTEEKSKPAETLADYRGNYKYNLLDDHLRAFNAEVPTFALWDNHEVMESWWPDEALPHAPAGEKNTLAFAARARRAFHEFLPIRETLAEPGRVYRKIQYGPLLDVFMLDMRSYRGPGWTACRSRLRTRRLSARAGTDFMAQAPARAFAGNVEGDRRGYGHRLRHQCHRHRTCRRPAGPRPRNRRSAFVHQARRRTQHSVGDGGPALHRRSLLRSEPGGVSGFRAVLGIRLGADPCRNLDAGYAGAHVRSAGRVPQVADGSAG